MADEQEAIADDGQETATEEVVETENILEDADTDQRDEEEPTNDDDTDDEPETDDDEESEDDQDDTEEYDTIEIDGEAYEVPAKLKSGFMMHKDYTQKTQEVAERAKALDARETEITQQAEATEQELSDRATLIGINERLDQYNKMTEADWQTLEMNDPLGAQQHQRVYNQLQRQHAEINDRVKAQQNERSQKAQHEYAKRVEETREFAQTQIKGWTPEIDKQVQQYAVSKGIGPEFIQQNLSPTMYGILYEAWIGRQSIEKQAAPKPAAKKLIKPATKVQGKTAPKTKVSLEDADMDEYVRQRNKQMNG